ncbi:MAG TPA: acetate--CoA ligase family protein [Thermodesulfobacteriota bacterium]|nr:acetate--CoA ligase family protein [Thermodesulfobacteriota bacterium]
MFDPGNGGTVMNSQSIIEKAKSASRTLLNEVESKALLSEAGIPVVETKLATSKQEAIAISKKLGFPVALKIVSPEITHKSDVGGVKLGLKTSKQVEAAYEEILSAVKQKYPQAVIDGVSVQKMARPGTEVIIGMTKDAQFGPVLMFGLGGILVELLKDVSFRIVPLEKEDAKEMIREIKGFPILEGFRGMEPVDVSRLEDILLKLSRFVDENPEIKELDLNPIFAYRDGAVAADARVILEK